MVPILLGLYSIKYLKIQYDIRDAYHYQPLFKTLIRDYKTKDPTLQAHGTRNKPPNSLGLGKKQGEETG